jgi:hypothetical protein
MEATMLNSRSMKDKYVPCLPVPLKNDEFSSEVEEVCTMICCGLVLEGAELSDITPLL